MRILFDHNLPRRLRQHLIGHGVETTRAMGWDDLKNGVLLRNAATAGFEVFLSIDKKIEHEQNLLLLPLPVVVLDAVSNALSSLLPLIPATLTLLSSPLTPALYVVLGDGTVLRLTQPR